MTYIHDVGSRLLRAAATIHSAIANATSAIIALGTKPRVSTSRAPARALEVARVGRPAPMAPALGRAAPSAILATPLVLASVAKVLVLPRTFTADPPSLAAASFAPRQAGGPITINYSPNVTIGTQDAGDDNAISQRVMKVLQRHGRDLYETLTRELIRRQRTEF